MNILFFGSTSDSVLVLEKLFTCHLSPVTCHLSAVVTQPPTPIGRKQIITPTPVEDWAKRHEIPVLSFATHAEKPWLYESQDDVINALSTFKPDLLVSACYGQKIPSQTIKDAKFGGLNVHPSLLPRWRGADPVPWTILSGDNQTGVTVVTLSDAFDTGAIIVQKKILLTDKDFSDPLRTKLFSHGAELLITALPDYVSGKNKGELQKKENETYARKLTRQDGFIPWQDLQAGTEGRDVPREQRTGISQLVASPISLTVLRMLRALSPWPGVWTLFKLNAEEKRLKILAAHTDHEKLILDTVQLEGKNPVPWEQFQKSYIVT